MIPYTMTHESITVVVDGKPTTVYRGTTQYAGLQQALLTEAWDQVATHLSPTKSLADWLGDAFTLKDGSIYYQDYPVPPNLYARIHAMATMGESPEPLLRFYERLARNPSWRSREQLFGFMEHTGIPIEPDGTFLAYKGVREDLLDCHTGTLDNKPGTVRRMPRNQISDDPNKTCHVGLHVGARPYASGFGPVELILRVDPEHVVCIPSDHNAQKMRVCEYTVIGFANGQELPSTTVTASDLGTPAEGWADDGDDGDDAIVVVLNEPAKEPPVSADPVKVVPVKRKSNAAKFNRMTPAELMQQSIDDLRRYAGTTLKIIGASKIVGGKTALVAQILKTRRRMRKG